MADDEVRNSLESFFRTRLPEAQDVRVVGLDSLNFGYSAEMLLLTLTWREESAAHSQDLVLRLRPPEPGLLEPYDIQRQYDFLRFLEPTDVLAPRALYLEATGAVLGRPFFVMERAPGDVYEWVIPDHLASAPATVRRMSESLVEQLAAIHAVDVSGAGAEFDDGAAFVTRELDHWEGEMNRVKRGPMPALERVGAQLRLAQPAPTPKISLVHGDAKPGNFAFVDGEVSAVFDWELATIGDPLADLGYLEILWRSPIGIPTIPGALTVDEIAEHYQRVSGTILHDREWYRAFAAFRIAVILLLGAMLVDQGHSDDERLMSMGAGIPFMTQMALADLGVADELESGPVTVRPERAAELAALKAGA